MYKLNLIDKISFILCMLGSINWGLIGLLDFNLFTFLTASSIIIQRVIYFLIFLSAIDLIILLFRCKYMLEQK